MFHLVKSDDKCLIKETSLPLSFVEIDQMKVIEVKTTVDSLLQIFENVYISSKIKSSKIKICNRNIDVVLVSKTSYIDEDMQEVDGGMLLSELFGGKHDDNPVKLMKKAKEDVERVLTYYFVNSEDDSVQVDISSTVSKSLFALVVSDRFKGKTTIQAREAEVYRLLGQHEECGEYLKVCFCVTPEEKDDLSS